MYKEIGSRAVRKNGRTLAQQSRQTEQTDRAVRQVEDGAVCYVKDRAVLGSKQSNSQGRLKVQTAT
jgi:hypothetical protein